MRIGVPKEVKDHEYRVGLTPESVREFVAAGHELSVETGAGAGINATDQAYLAAGATIVDTAAEIFAKSEMIVKVKEPQESEWTKLRENQIVFAFLHLAADLARTRGLLASGCTAVAYETVTGPDGQGLPLLAPMREIAGRLAIEAAGEALRRQNGGRGILFQGRAKTRFASAAAIEDVVLSADAVIGAVLIPGAAAPKLVTEQMLSRMKQGAVLVDIAIDQGGCFESSHATTHAAPTFIKGGVVHYCVANMPGAVPFTSTHALNNAALPYGLALAAGGLGAIASNPGLRGGLNVHRGHVADPGTAASLGFALKPPESALAA